MKSMSAANVDVPIPSVYPLVYISCASGCDENSKTTVLADAPLGAAQKEFVLTLSERKNVHFGALCPTSPHLEQVGADFTVPFSLQPLLRYVSGRDLRWDIR